MSYYFIVNTHNGYVLDVEGSNTAPRTRIINFPRNTPTSNNQLWERVPTGSSVDGGQSEYYFKTKLNGNVIDITGSNTAPNTQLISFPTNSPASSNQIWKIVESQEVSGSFFLVSLLNGNVVTVGEPDGKFYNTVSAPKKSESDPSQLWHFVSESSPNPGKKGSGI